MEGEEDEGPECGGREMHFKEKVEFTERVNGAYV